MMMQLYSNDKLFDTLLLLDMIALFSAEGKIFIEKMYKQIQKYENEYININIRT